MEKLFLLGGLVVFSPDRNVLHAKSDASKRLSLSNPASRCLLLLIQRQGQVIERDYFFQHVWFNNGAQVTNNTFYQNISLLRRAFKEFGLNEELIVTVPKVGIRLEPQLEVLEEEVEDPPPEPAPSAPLDSALTEKASGRWRTIYWLLAGAVCCLAASAIAWQSQFDLRLSHYVPFSDEKGCHWYANQDVINFDGHKQFASTSKLDCQNYPWVYLSLYPNFPRISALTCREQYSRWRNNECVTHYYFKEPRHVGA
ncbi:CadC family transcriptional regulator [Enterobacteriaceae bacterium 89]|nr:CadC family transcriptional regulator [Enterobacteriaceae bacterium 89]